MSKVYVCPDGHHLLGTLERLSGVAQTNEVTDPDNPDYESYTEVSWDSQTTICRVPPGSPVGTKEQIVWICDDGNEWLASQLVPEEEEEDDW